MLPATSQRVALHTKPSVNERIHRHTQNRLARYRHATPEQLTQRLQELDQEWDIERTLEANAATLAFSGCVLAATTDRRWLALPLLVTGFLFQHAVQGWCPPLPILRRMGFRTTREIDGERQAIKVLRGDFRQLREEQPTTSAAEVLEATER